MEEEKKSFKKMSVVPSERDFVDAILSLHADRVIVFPKFKKSLRRQYVGKVWCAKKKFLDKLSTVLDELPLKYHGDLLFQRFPPIFLTLAREQVLYATIVISKISEGFVRLLKKDGCDSLDKCKRLKVAALGCIYTVAIRCIPSLEYLDRVREYMANFEDDEIAAGAATFTNKTHQDVLPENQDVLRVEDCTVPPTFDVHNAADFVDPGLRSWNVKVASSSKMMIIKWTAKLGHKHKEHLALPSAACKPWRFRSFICLYIN